MVKKKKSSRLSKLKLAGAAGVAAATAIGATIFLSFGKGKPVPAASYTAIRVGEKCGV